METVMVIGATGHIGAAAVQAALRSNLKVIALVRNQASASKLYKHLGTQEGITAVEVDVVSDHGVQSIVEKVEAGQLPAFQHVYSCVGGRFGASSLLELSMDEVREYMRVNFEPNLIAYKATMPYLLKQNDPRSTWTICTGAQGDLGFRPGPSLTQGALFSLAVAACRETAGTVVRFNEVYLACLVQMDAEAEKSGLMKSSEFSKSYSDILARNDIKGCRVYVNDKSDLQAIRYQSRI